MMSAYSIYLRLFEARNGTGNDAMLLAAMAR